MCKMVFWVLAPYAKIDRKSLSSAQEVGFQVCHINPALEMMGLDRSGHTGPGENPGACRGGWSRNCKEAIQHLAR